MIQAKLTKSEQAIEDLADTVKPYPLSHPIYQQVYRAAQNTARSTPISLRLRTETLTHLKTKAKRAGLPYQTYINSILHQVATDQITVKL
jgi:predicted DNA binding CopG/RHH family protein